MKKVCLILMITFLFTTYLPVSAAVDPSTWAATDDLGRSLSSYDDLQKENKKDRYVGMFFWDWHTDFAKQNKAVNLTELLAKYPEAKNDYNHPAWQENVGKYFWNEPIYGYYSSEDAYVVRKQAELLADAGVDVIIFDCTNGNFLWWAAFSTIFAEFEKAREDGVNTPQIAFMLNFQAADTTATMLEDLYESFYSQGSYQDLWFQWNGKPLIFAYPDSLDSNNATHKAILDFFTFKPMEPSYKQRLEPSESYWGWLSLTPQGAYGPTTDDGRPEEMAVGVSQNANYEGTLTAMNDINVRGRTYTIATGSSSGELDDLLRGVNFQEQWDRAIEADPDFIFVTGWNEWVANRQEEWQDVENAFPDEFSDEFSRDIEPSRGILKDYYYMQLCENIRRYKGVTKPETLEDSQYKASIDITGDVSQWNDIYAYEHYTNSTYKRRRSGYINTRYKNDATRNDVVTAKVAYDDDNIYFYVKTADELTPYTDSAWMRLFLNTDFTDAGNNWEGFEYVLNRINPTADKCTLERAADSDGNEEYKGWVWETVGEVDYTVQGNVLQIAIPRSMLGMENTAPNLSFKWSDDMQTDGDILDFYQYGEAAPGSRFTYVFNPTGANEQTPVEPGNTPASTSNEPSNPAIGTAGSRLLIWVICGITIAIVAVIAVVIVIVLKKKK